MLRMALLPGRPDLTRLAAIFVILALMSMSACSWRSAGGGGNRNSNRSGGNANANSDAQDAPVPVTVGKSEARQVSAVIQATGSLTAQETSDVAPKVAGKVTNVYVNVGDFVGSGATIAKLDDTDARQRVAVAQAAVRQQEAAVRQAEAKLGLGPNGKFNASAIPEVRAAGSAYEQAQAQLKQAEANEKRYRELIESGDVAMATYEQYRTARRRKRVKRPAGSGDQHSKTKQSGHSQRSGGVGRRTDERRYSSASRGGYCHPFSVRRLRECSACSCRRICFYCKCSGNTVEDQSDKDRNSGCRG